MKQRMKKLLILCMLITGTLAKGAGYNGEMIAPNKRVSVDYQGADLVNVLRGISFDNNLNMVIDDSIQGTVTLSVRNALIDDLLEAILRSNGYTYLQSGNLVEVMTVEKAVETINTDKPSSQIFKLENVNAGEIMGDVRKLLKDGDTIIENPDNNSLTVRARRREMFAVEEFLRGRDGKSIEEVRKNVELIRTKHLSPTQVYEVLVEMGYKVAGDIRISETLNGLLVIANKSEVSKLKSVIESIDTPDHQVVIEARIVEVSEGDERNWGISWSYNKDNGQDNRGSGGDSGGDDGGGDGAFSPISGVDTVIDASNISNGISIGLGLLGNDQFTAIYRNIVTDKSTEILAKPTITTLNNMKAKIDLVDEVPYKQLEYIGESGESTSTSYEFKEVGITLEVTPQISEDGMIKMEVAPTISEVTGKTDDGVPFISKRSVETNVIVRNGETLAIGGLIKDTSTRTDTKNPFLSRIPIIGYFFRSSSNDKNKTNLMIFITPKLILNRELTDRINIVEGTSGSGAKTVSRDGLPEKSVAELKPTEDEMSDNISTGINRIQEKLQKAIYNN